MILIRCTQKLFAEMGIDSKSLLPESSEVNVSAIEEWYAHLIELERHKCIVFMNASTHFVTIAFGKKRQEIQQLQEVFVSSLAETLQAEGVSPEITTQLLQLFETASFGKTIDRRVLGCINDTVHQLQYFVEAARQTSLGELDRLTITRKLNRSPWVKAQYPFAIDGMTVLLRATLGWDGHFSQNIEAL